jgi:hypothetical protein
VSPHLDLSSAARQVASSRLTGFHRFSRAAGWRGAILVLSLLPACGYSHQGLYPADVRTVAVPIFENKSFYRGVEFDLSEALAKQIELVTPYKVTSPGGADTILQGTIVAVTQTMISRTFEGGLPEEMETRIVVDFAWKNTRTGQTLRQRQGFAATGRYVATRPIGEAYPTGQHAAVEQLATRIVETLRRDW